MTTHYIVFSQNV